MPTTENPTWPVVKHYDQEHLAKIALTGLRRARFRGAGAVHNAYLVARKVGDAVPAP